MAQQISSTNADTLSRRVDSRYAWRRLVASLIIGSVGGVGMWSPVILLPEIQNYFDLDRSQASLAFTVGMLGIVFGNVFMGRMVISSASYTTLASAFALFGYVAIAFIQNFWLFLFFSVF